MVCGEVGGHLYAERVLPGKKKGAFILPLGSSTFVTASAFEKSGGMGTQRRPYQSVRVNIWGGSVTLAEYLASPLFVLHQGKKA